VCVSNRWSREGIVGGKNGGLGGGCIDELWSDINRWINLPVKLHFIVRPGFTERGSNSSSVTQQLYTLSRVQQDILLAFPLWLIIGSKQTVSLHKHKHTHTHTYTHHTHVYNFVCTSISSSMRGIVMRCSSQIANGPNFVCLIHVLIYAAWRWKIHRAETWSCFGSTIIKAE